MVIRQAESADAPQVAELLGELGYPTNASETAERLARGTEAIFVAVDNQKTLAGLIAIWSQLPLVRARPVARITAMVVRSDSRRQGIGRSLVERATSWASSAGCEGIELTSGIGPEREDAHRFYEGLGFQRTSHRFWMPLNNQSAVR